MAYAAVVCLQHTINHLLNSSHISITPHSRELMESVYRQARAVQLVLKRIDSSSKSCSRKRVNILDGQIRETVCRLEDVIESHVVDQILSQSEESNPLLFSIDLNDLKQQIQSLTKKVKNWKKVYKKASRRMLHEEDGDVVSSSTGFCGKKSKMVGFSDLFEYVRFGLGSFFGLSDVVSLVGMGGIGKTTLAKEIFDDPVILSHFDCRAWVTVGRRYRLKEMQWIILAQVNPNNEHILTQGHDEDIARCLKESLEDRRFFIVLDDVWETSVCHDLKILAKNKKDRGRIFLTTRLREVAESCDLPYIIDMRLLNNEESWDLFCERVFGEDNCPPQLEKIGRKIVENCDGLPLMICTVAEILSQEDKTPEYWNKIAKKRNPVFTDAYNKISKVLFPSYDYLPQHLKPCFLYMGVFPKRYEIPKSKIIDMWIVEGLLETKIEECLDDYAIECLEKLVSNSLVMIYKKSTNIYHEIKTCGLHSSFWHLCNIEAGKSKFFHVLDIREDGLVDGLKGQRRLCIHNNVLLAINDVCISIEKNCASTARSLVCFGPYHQYPVQIHFNLRLLRVVDALTIRFYEFPMKILKLVQLRYLALSLDGMLPPLISKLQNLQFLIVRRHLSINRPRGPTYLPMEIWNMKELKHLKIMGSDLPYSNGSCLENLETLLDVSSHSCTKNVLERIPNLEKLGIRIELALDAADPFCFKDIYFLDQLKSLKCVVINPQHTSNTVPRPDLSYLPFRLQKMSLSGFGYTWEQMSFISSMPYLKVFKLRCYAFRGSKWELPEHSFMKLEFVLIEDTDLVQWKVGRGSFPRLTQLSLKHCYKLQEINGEFGQKCFLKIEVVDCNPLTMTWAEDQKYNSAYDVYVKSSWDLKS